MTENVVTHISISIARTGGYFTLYRCVSYVESSLSHGRRRQIHEHFDGLTAEERNDVLDHLIDSVEVGQSINVVNDTIVSQPSLF